VLRIELLLARRLANLYWSPFRETTGYYSLKWSELKSLAGDQTLRDDEFNELTRYLLEFGYLISQSKDGVVIWHGSFIEPKEISEYALNNALKLALDEDENEIENEYLEALSLRNDNSE